MGSHGEIVRPAGILERFHITRHLLGFDSCVLCAGQYTAEGGTELTQPVLFYALRKVVETHAALSVRLTGESTQRPSFTRLDGVHLSKVVEYVESDDLNSVFEAQLLRPFDTNADLPLWRVVVLKNNFLCFAWHHCIGDGLSGLAFHRTLLSSFPKGETPSDFAEYVVAPSTAILAPAIETAASLSPSWYKVLQELYNMIAPTSWTRGASAWTGNIVGTDVTLKTHVRFITFSAAEVTDFLVLCRSRNASFTSALYTLAISVLSTLISAEGDVAPKTISSYIPISLRDVAGTSQDAFCNHVSTYHAFPSIQSNFSWSTASEVTSTLRTHILKSGEEIGMLKYLFGRYAAYFRGKIGSKREGGLELSNLGPCKIGGYKCDVRWSITGMAFAQCDAVVGAALKLNVVGNPDGGVTVAVTWGDGSISKSLGESFVSGLEQSFKGLLKESKVMTTQ